MHSGILADVAPTMLQLLGLQQPPEMTGHSLLEPAPGASQTSSTAENCVHAGLFALTVRVCHRFACRLDEAFDERALRTLLPPDEGDRPCRFALGKRSVLAAFRLVGIDGHAGDQRHAVAQRDQLLHRQQLALWQLTTGWHNC